MARVLIPVTQVTREGVLLAQAVPGDPVNGHLFHNNGATALVVTNNDVTNQAEVAGGAVPTGPVHTVTVLIPGLVDIGIAKPPRIYQVPVGAFLLAGGLPGIYNQPPGPDGADIVFLDVDSATLGLMAYTLA